MYVFAVVIITLNFFYNFGRFDGMDGMYAMGCCLYWGCRAVERRYVDLHNHDVYIYLSSACDATRIMTKAAVLYSP